MPYGHLEYFMHLNLKRFFCPLTRKNVREIIQLLTLKRDYKWEATTLFSISKYAACFCYEHGVRLNKPALCPVYAYKEYTTIMQHEEAFIGFR